MCVCVWARGSVLQTPTLFKGQLCMTGEKKCNLSPYCQCSHSTGCTNLYWVNVRWRKGHDPKHYTIIRQGYTSWAVALAVPMSPSELTEAGGAGLPPSNCSPLSQPTQPAGTARLMTLRSSSGITPFKTYSSQWPNLKEFKHHFLWSSFEISTNNFIVLKKNVYIYVCIYIHTHTHTYVFIHLNVHSG